MLGKQWVGVGRLGLVTQTLDCETSGEAHQSSDLFSS